ncbi:MAG: hypothetical protein HQ523_07810 [Lentisphaerae bacterium]|nr:hypothetical protein [Lentisphaerota bacterium]
MDIYEIDVEHVPAQWREKIVVVPDRDALNRRLAVEFADALETKQAASEMLTLICPVGPVDYRYFVEEIDRRRLSCRNLRTINMDEYVDENDELISKEHPLSFRRFMDEQFFSLLPEDRRPLPENVLCPDPKAPEKTTQLIDEIGGADLCWTGFGITGHIAFNDPPHMLGESTDLDDLRNCKTRVLRCSDMSTAQMAMGGTHGNMEIIPERAVTMGMYELLKTKRFGLIMMRNWHAGLWRRALLGPVTSAFPGSLLQEHPNLTVTITELAAAPPMVDAHQDTGEEA